MNIFSHLFKEREKVWFLKLQSFLPVSPEEVLKIGNGFGHLSEMVRSQNQNTTIIDVAVFQETVNKDRVMLYDGEKLPFLDKSFNTTILNLTLHHIKDSRKFFEDEILRVTKKRIVLIEETYDNLFQKVHLVLRDWWMNHKAGQDCDIHWTSYFSRSEMARFIQDHGLRPVARETIKHHSYFKELIVIDLP